MRLRRLWAGRSEATGPTLDHSRPESLGPATTEPGWTPSAAVVVPAGSRTSAALARLRTLVADRLPPALRSGVLDPGRRGLVALSCLALVGAGLGGWYFLRAQPSLAASSASSVGSGAGDSSRPQPVASAGATSMPPLPTSWSTGTPTGSTGTTSRGAASMSATPSGSATAGELVVDVVGRVRHPGVVAVPAGARIDDAITAAGGIVPGTDVTGFDLAAKAVDGEEIFVGIPPPSGQSADAAGGVVSGPDGALGGGVSGDPTATAPAIVDLNSAGLTELETLPGVGAVLAQHILDWRNAHGRFGSVTQLRQVSGIGPAKYAGLVARVTA